MKTNKILAAAVAALFSASAANAEISLAENLTLSGYIDGSYSNLDSDNPLVTGDELGVDELELDFAFSGETISAEVHLDNVRGGGDEFGIEQAYVAYNLGNGLSISGGRLENSLGFEEDENPELYQNSYAYNNAGDGSGVSALGQNYNNGIRASYTSDAFSVSLAGFDQLWGNATAGNLDLAYEVFATYTGVENLTLAIGYGEDDNSVLDEVSEALNLWAQYEQGSITVAAEYSDLESAAGTDGDHYLILANYAFSEKGAITVRYSEQEWDGGAEFDKFTISPGYAVTDNLWALIEYSTGEADGNDYDYFAVETTFTF
jgi:hypothetical protein